MGPRRAALIWNNRATQSRKGFGTRREACGIGRLDQLDNDAIAWPAKAAGTAGAAAMVTVQDQLPHPRIARDQCLPALGWHK